MSDMETAVLQSNNETIQELTALIGVKNTVALIQEYGGSSLYIPLPRTLERLIRNQEIYRGFLDGISYTKLGKMYGVASNTVHEIVYNMQKAEKEEAFTWTKTQNSKKQ